MSNQKFILGEFKVSIPDYYQQVDSTSDDPEGSIPLMVRTGNAVCFMLLNPIRHDQAIPRDQENLIQGVRQFLGDNHGLIKIETGSDYSYSIVKTLLRKYGERLRSYRGK